jgi:hypothetical protein
MDEGFGEEMELYSDACEQLTTFLIEWMHSGDGKVEKVEDFMGIVWGT